MIQPTHIHPTCSHCGALLEPRVLTFPNADSDEWICPSHTEVCSGLYFDWPREEFIRAHGEVEGNRWADLNCLKVTK